MANAIGTNDCVFLDQSYDDLNVFEFSNIDTNLLMDLLQDSEAEDRELVPNMIQSFLAHDDQEIMNCDQSCSETEESSSEDYYGLSEVDELECCSTSPHHHREDFEWMDMEIGEMQGGYFITGDHMIGEVGGLEDYAQACYGISMEEDDYIALWQ